MLGPPNLCKILTPCLPEKVYEFKFKQEQYVFNKKDLQWAIQVPVPGKTLCVIWTICRKLMKLRSWKEYVDKYKVYYIFLNTKKKKKILKEQPRKRNQISCSHGGQGVLYVLSAGNDNPQKMGSDWWYS